MNTDPLILLKRSLEKDKIPTISQLGLGELAINHFDGKVFVRQDTQGAAGIATRVVQVGAAGSLGKTYFVAITGDDTNSGLNEISPLRTIKAAAEKAIPGDTIKIAPGTFVENNPVTFQKNVSVEGYELRNCIVTPQNPDKDLFYVSDGCHVTDMSFIGQPSTNGAAVIAFPPLLGVAGDRYFDAARLLRFNADFIAREAVGFLTSGYSGLAGSQRAQDAARLLDLNKEFIAREAVGFLTSGYSGYAADHRTQDAARLLELNRDFISFEAADYIDSSDYTKIGNLNATEEANLRSDIKTTLDAVIYDLISTGNEKSVGNTTNFFENGSLITRLTGAGFSGALIDGLVYAAGIATHVINNYAWGGITSTTTNVVSFDYTASTGVATVTTDANHDLGFDDVAKLANIEFTCPGGSGITTTIFPDHTRGDTFPIVDIVGVSTFVINVGISTIDHTYVTGGTVTSLQNRSDYTQTFRESVSRVNYGCVAIGNSINTLIGITTNVISVGNTSGLPTVVPNAINLYTADCADDVKDIITAVSHDLKANGNIKSVGAAQSYFVGGSLAHISEPGIPQQTIDTLEYAADIMESVINTRPWGTIPAGQNKNITGFDYTASTGIGTITAVGHGVTVGDTVKLTDISFTCPGGSGITTTIFPDGTQGYFFEVKEYLNENQIKIFAGISTIDHTYDSGGILRKYENFQETYQQDLDNSVIQVRGGCVGVANTIRQLVGIVTDAIGAGNTSGLPGITTGIRLDMEKCFRDIKFAYKAVCYDITRGGNKKCVSIGKTYFDENGNKLGILVDPDEYEQTVVALNYSKDIARAVVNNVIWGGKLDPTWSRDVAGGTANVGITTVDYDKLTGITTITTAVGHGVTFGDTVKLAGIAFTCPGGSGITTTIFPDGTIGPVFPVKKYVSDTKFEVITGISNIDHTYVSGGTVAKQTTFQDYITQIRDLSIQSDFETGYNDTINSCANVISAVNTCVGVITSIISEGFDAFESPSNPTGIVTTYEGNNGAGSVVPNDPSFSPGTDGPVFKGPYVRNCTNFIQDSIGMRINGFDAEPGDQDDIGVQGSMSVDSYTQYNQGGIGVSISNGAYAQLVSIFTICCNEAIVTETGGQCDLTNSNSSFGTFGLVSRGVGDQNSNSIYRLTATVAEQADIGDTRVVLSGVGTQRPYDGQALFFDQLYEAVEVISVIDGGSGYTGPAPKVTIASPTGPDGITAQAIPIVEDGVITSILVANSGNQYETAPAVIIDPPDEPGGRQAVAEVTKMALQYYKVASATLPHAGISTVTLTSNVPTTIEKGATAFISRQSLQITSSHSFEYVGAGNAILTARPSVGGIVIEENEVVMEDGGLVIYTSTDQAGNFKIGDGITIDQATGTLSGRVYIKSLFNNVTPFILALGG